VEAVTLEVEVEAVTLAVAVDNPLLVAGIRVRPDPQAHQVIPAVPIVAESVGAQDGLVDQPRRLHGLRGSMRSPKFPPTS
jgi:hypothetical protein